MRKFNDKIVYITGGSSGIGLSTGRLLAQLGAHVIVFARNETRLAAALAEMEGRRVKPKQMFAFRCLDVTDPEAVRTVMGEAVQSFGTPDILINCVGRALPHYFEEIDFAQFDETMKVNLYGIWNCVSALVPHMKSKGGTIVNISSMCGFMGVFGYTDYCASKFGVIGFSQALRQELQSYKVKVSVLCPPDTETPGFATENLTKPEETKAVSSGAKIMSPNDVAMALIKGIEHDRFMIIPGSEGTMAYLIQRYVPSVLDWFMQSAIRKAQKKRM
ncbi:MAG: SDR family oxidoreductase [Deltaproteobacteria bacterium]|nr:SDR family oxidoreductase [Deltaproteobacteria bacterium]